jgi:hypothetical protein
MPDQNFDPEQILVNGQVPSATGTLKGEYDPMDMHFGIVQVNDYLNDDFRITAGAYAMGLPLLGNEQNGVKPWTMKLQPDADNFQFTPGRPAFGFVLVMLKGGGFTGWIDKVALKPKT